MISDTVEINWSDLSESFPAFATIIGIPLTFSISDGIGFGFISYIIVALITGNVKKIKPLMWVAGVMFIVYFFLL